MTGAILLTIFLPFVALIAALLTLCGQLSDRMGLVLGQHIDHVRDLASAGRRAPIAGHR